MSEVGDKRSFVKELAVEGDRKFEVLNSGEGFEFLEIEEKKLLDMMIIEVFEVGLGEGQQFSHMRFVADLGAGCKSSEC